jgi:hypothetical protein
MTVQRKRTRGRLASTRGHAQVPGRLGGASTRITTTGALGRGSGGDEDLRAAAGDIAGEAKALAAKWSRTIPGSIGVAVSGNVADITATAAPAYPNEVAGVRHPVYGHDRWVTNEHRPFMGPAADSKADAAMATYAKKIDRAARKAGFS